MNNNIRNIDGCLSWLYNNIRLTAEEQKLFDNLFKQPKKENNTKKELFTNNEKDYILKNYKKKTSSEIARDLNKYEKRTAIFNFLKRHGLKALTRKEAKERDFYDKSFDANIKKFILENYKEKTILQMAKETHQTIYYVTSFLKKSGIYEDRKRLRKGLSDDEKKYILENYKKKSIRKIAKDLNRTKSIAIIFNFLKKGNKNEDT